MTVEMDVMTEPYVKPAMRAAIAKAKARVAREQYAPQGEGTWLVIEGGDVYPEADEISALRRVNALAQDATKCRAVAWFVAKGSSLWQAQGYDFDDVSDA